MPNLDSTEVPQFPNVGTPGSRNSGSMLDSSGGGGSFDWKSLAGGGLGLLGSLFAPKSKGVANEVGKIESSASDLNATGKSQINAGQAALSPALDYFKKLVSGDPSAILEATAPDRARVIDQYDAARKGIAQFTPRGGGQASALNANRTKEASDLVTTTSSARSNAANMLAQIGQSTTGQGISAEEASVNALAQTLQPLLSEEKQSKDDVTSIFSGIGDLLGAVLFA